MELFAALNLEPIFQLTFVALIMLAGPFVIFLLAFRGLSSLGRDFLSKSQESGDRSQEIAFIYSPHFPTSPLPHFPIHNL